MRIFLLILHRWAGLTLAFVLVVTGLTGAILPFQRELGVWIAAEVWSVEKPDPSAQPLSGIELARRVEAETGGVVSYIVLAPDPTRTQAIFVSERPEGPVLDYEEVFVDPFTGEIRAKVRYADLRDGAVNVMPFLVSFHYSLSAGEWGRLAMGLAALVWFIEALVGLGLSFPRKARNLGQALRRWGPAWTVRREQGTLVVTHDLHRAAGLWVWPVMLVFAWSAMAFNLDAVHAPVQRLLGAEGLYQPVVNPAPAAGEPMSPEQAALVGARLMEQEAERRGFTIRGPEALSFNPYAQVTGYYARTSLDGPTENGSTAVWFDQVSGRLISFRPPFGETAADAVDKTARMLHTADFFGWPYRIFVSLFGLLTAIMAIAGVILWWRRSGARRAVSMGQA